MNEPSNPWYVIPTAAGAAGNPGEGQSERLGTAFEAFRGYLTVVARRELLPDLGGKIGASDLVQETFLAAGRDIAQLRGRGPESLRCWLVGILKHLLTNTRRRYKATQKRRMDVEITITAGGGSHWRGDRAADPTASTTSPSGRAMRREREQALRAAMMKLPEHYRQVIEWHNEERLTFNAVAARLGVSPEAARKMWGRALMRLRENLGPGHDPR
jgi:RNA polymerase sigma-70 factor (ECF subfamily)